MEVENAIADSIAQNTLNINIAENKNIVPIVRVTG